MVRSDLFLCVTLLQALLCHPHAHIKTLVLIPDNRVVINYYLFITDAWQSLQQFPGVGGKVSDCVCLMGLGHLEAVPVDVHISRLAVRDYASYLPPNLANLKSLSSSNYQIIGEQP